MMDDHSRIPIYESEVLQDVSIELGRRLKSVRYAARAGELEFRISTAEIEGVERECLDVIRWMDRREYIQVVICESGAANFVYREPMANRHDTARYEAYVISVAGWTPHETADLIRDSLLNDAAVRETWRKLDQRKRS